MINPNFFFEVKYIKTKNKLRKIITYKNDYPEIRIQHSKINDFIDKNFIPSKFTKAYIKNHSIYHNAIAHMYNDIFISLDIKNFFNNINHDILTNALFYELNKQNNNIINKLECRKIVSKCSISKKGLPLGFITSPILSNVYMKEFDNIIYGKLKKMCLKNVIYTRYADDLVISFKQNEEINDNIKEVVIYKIISQIKLVLKRYKLQLHPSKTKIISFEKSNHVKITGVNIVKTPSNHRRISIGRKLKNDLFHDAIRCFEEKNRNRYDVMKIKGLESFILSIEKRNYEQTYSLNMKKKVTDLGFNSLHDLIKSLYYEN